MKRKEAILYAFRRSLPIMAGYLVLGMGFGILLESKGYSPWWALLMSITMYAGSMQYVAVDLLSGGATLLVTAFMTIMINIRHVFYGLTMLEPYKDVGKTKPYLIFALTDETFSLVCFPVPLDRAGQKTYYFFLSLFNQCYWICGCVLGAVVGQSFQFDTAGVDFAMTALFVVIFVEQWEKTKEHLPALGGIAISLVCLLVFGAENFLIPSMLGISAMLMVCRKRLEKKEEPHD